LINAEYLGHQIEEAANAEVITADEASRLRSYHEKLRSLMAVDDFPADEIGRANAASESASGDDGASSRPATRSAAKSKAGAKKKSSGRRKQAPPAND
jgi:acyl-CoA dehydrogenase